MKLPRPEAPAGPPSSTAATGDTTTDHPALLAARRWGAKVIPLEPSGKQPRITNWPNRGSTDEATIRGWLAKCPTMNYGIVCGPTGWLVLDEVQADELARLYADHGQELPQTLRLRTGRGYHLIFRQPSKPIGNCGALKQAGYQIDIKGDGGYIVGPGSMHASGARYEVADDLPVAELPGWLEKLLRGKKTQPVAPVGDSSYPMASATPYAQKAMAGQLADLAATPEGNRSNQLNTAAFRAGQLTQDGQLRESDAVPWLQQVAGQIGLAPGEAKATIESGIRAGWANPRTAGQGGDTSAELVPLDWHALWADDTELEWIVQPLLPERRQITLYSRPKLGKSLLALEIAAAVSRGGEVFGRPARQRRVLYVDFENDPRGDVRQRLQAMGCGPDDLENLFYLSFPQLAKLNTERGAVELLAALERFGCELLVLDTFARAVTGKENDNDTWNEFYRFTGLALKQAGISMIRLDHSGKDETRGPRGGSAKTGDVDATWQLTDLGPGRVGLALDSARFYLQQTDRALVLIRKSDPLRHLVDRPDPRPAADRLADPQPGLFDPQVVALCAQLAELDVPAASGRPTCEKALRANGAKYSKAALEQAIKWRKEGSE